MADKKVLLGLVKSALSKKGYSNFSADQVEETLREEFKKLCPSRNAFMKNRYDIYEIMQEAIDDIVPKNIANIMGQFAEVRDVGHGQTVQFKKPVGRERAKQFVTKVAPSGVYEAFRLDKETFEVPTTAYGGAARIDFERFLSGDEDFAEYQMIIMDGIEEAVYREVQKALRASLNSSKRPTANKVITAGFEADKMAKLVATVRNYGNGAVIFATPEFVAEMGPDAIGGEKSPAYSVNDIEDIRTKGYIGIFRGAPIVMLPNTFTDETNTKTWLDPQMAYVMPTGGYKPVKVVFEGNTQVADWQNPDWSMEIQAYKKLGAAIYSENNWGIYQNTSIENTYIGDIA